MWLLRTNRADLKYFHTPPPKYAILSHVWGENEQSFQDVQALHSIATGADDNPRSHASAKIRDCCIHAESQGYEWLWIDSCCIDKTSSAELSEAINSMFQWYANASVCYVYLQDVRADEDPWSLESTFRASRWFTRGWTLQELLAPRDVQFISRDWVWMGDKVLFAELVEEVTGIEIDVLMFRVPVSSVCVATRMQWAASRSTTRVEDEAYSLMGIFGVHLPTIYGEGKGAFRRLQEAIMRTTQDHTLFAWGPWLGFDEARSSWHRQGPAHNQALFADSPACFAAGHLRTMRTSSVYEFWESIASLSGSSFPGDTDCGDSLFALSYKESEKFSSRYEPGSRAASVYSRIYCESDKNSYISFRHEFDRVPQFVVTSHGIRAHLPIVDIKTRSATFSLALLTCHVSGTPLLIGLVLDHLHRQALYRVGCTLFRAESSAQHSIRCVYFDPLDPYWRTSVSKLGRPAYTWKDIYIAQPHATFSLNPSAPQPTVYSSNNHHVLVPYYVISRLQKQGFVPATTDSQSTDCYHTVRRLRRNRSGPSTSYVFNRTGHNETLVLSIGLSATAGLEDRARLWLIAEMRSSEQPDLPLWLSHSDPRYLVRNWAGIGESSASRVRSREYLDSRRGGSVRLNVTDARPNPTRTDDGFLWVVDVVLRGFQLPSDDADDVQPESWRRSPLVENVRGVRSESFRVENDLAFQLATHRSEDEQALQVSEEGDEESTEGSWATLPEPYEPPPPYSFHEMDPQVREASARSHSPRDDDTLYNLSTSASTSTISLSDVLADAGVSTSSLFKAGTRHNHAM